jgi:tetraacyldisaccharide 4'-kinase
MMRAPRFWDRDVDPKSREGAPVTRLLLSPLAAIYSSITARRIADTTPAELDIPIICVGNLTAGGSGKSPVVSALRKHVHSTFPDKRVATLSRGYGGKLKGPVRVDPDTHTAQDVGDEALMFSAHGEAWIGADRADAGRSMQEAGVDLIIMDDGHQNPGLAKTISIIVVDTKAGFGNGHVIPKGPLREPVSTGLARADAIVLMGEDEPPLAVKTFAGPVLQAGLVPVSDLKAGDYIAFAGIGRPEKFFDTLAAIGRKPVDAVPFPDHHNYSRSDLNYLRGLAAKHHARLVTTEKDHIRLGAELGKEVDILPVEARFTDEDAVARLLKPVAQRVSP